LTTFTGAVAVFSLQAFPLCTGLVAMLLRFFLPLDFTLVVVGGSARSLCLLGLAFLGEGVTLLKQKSYWVWTMGMWYCKYQGRAKFLYRCRCHSEWRRLIWVYAWLSWKGRLGGGRRVNNNWVRGDGFVYVINHGFDCGLGTACC
jgi:hypothetical protein